MKATMHNGRKGSAKHNDRTFDTTKADHIKDSSKNIYLNCYDEDLTFEEVERRYYTEQYSDMLNETNARYRKSGHKNRCKTIDDYLKMERYKPEETILQIGNISESVDKCTIVNCTLEYVETINQKYGNNLHILDLAFHFDETTPHVHIRQVWDYEEDGMKKIGQTEALKKLGFELPNPEKKKGRNNNLKMAYTEEARKLWYDILEKNGMEIDKMVKNASQKHKEILEYKVEQLKNEIMKKQSKLEELNKQSNAMVEECNSLMDRKQNLEIKIQETEDEFVEKVNGYRVVLDDLEKDYVNEDYESLDSKINRMHEISENEKLQRVCVAKQKIIVILKKIIAKYTNIKMEELDDTEEIVYKQYDLDGHLQDEER